VITVAVRTCRGEMHGRGAAVMRGDNGRAERKQRGWMQWTAAAAARGGWRHCAAHRGGGVGRRRARATRAARHGACVRVSVRVRVTVRLRLRLL